MRKKRAGSKIEIRRLSVSDYEKMVDVWKRAKLPVKLRGRESRMSIEKQMREAPDLFLGAFENDELIGIIIGSSEVRKGWLNRIAVVPEKRGRGIAKDLTVKAEKALKNRGIAIIGLLVEKNNIDSIQLAKSLGYKEHPNILYLTKRENEDV